ncbi:MAG: hemerythrin domain-containing protein [Hyphomicrobium sp.]
MRFDAEDSMHGPLHALLADDHARLDALLRRAMDDPARIDAAAYAAFRAGLLKHIGMEEKILLPAAQRARGGEPLPIAAKLRLDHGAIAALLVPPPTLAVVTALRAILAAHNPIEEGPGGLYDTCEELAGAERDAFLARLRAAPEVPVARHVDGPRVLASARRALERAGFHFDLEGTQRKDT